MPASSLFDKFVNFGLKKSFNVDPWHSKAVIVEQRPFDRLDRAS